MKTLLAVLALMIALPTSAAEEEAVGYGGAKVQLQPIMAPYRTPSGVKYQVVTLRLVLDVGVNERPACFMIPLVHEKIVLHLYKKMLQPADLEGQRLEVFIKDMLDVATAATARGFYSGVELVGPDAPALDPKSQTLTSQCK
jgi:hypothetical protein